MGVNVGSWCRRPLTATAGRVWSGGAATRLTSLVLPTYSFSLKSRARGRMQLLQNGGGALSPADLSLTSLVPTMLHTGCRSAHSGLLLGNRLLAFATPSFLLLYLPVPFWSAAFINSSNSCIDPCPARSLDCWTFA